MQDIFIHLLYAIELSTFFNLNRIELDNNLFCGFQIISPLLHRCIYVSRGLALWQAVEPKWPGGIAC